MKNIITITLLSATIACAQEEPAPSAETTTPILNVSMYDTPLIDREIALNDPYELKFEVEKDAEGQYSLVTTIELFGGSFYVSPHSTGDFKGKFRVEAAPNDNLKIGEDFVETPRSMEVIDQHRFVNGPVNWVKEATRYEYPITIHTTEDFDIGGKIVFVIEPKCTLEVIGLLFKYRSGELVVEELKC